MRKKGGDLHYSREMVASRRRLWAKNHRVKFSGKNEVIFWGKTGKIATGRNHASVRGYLARTVSPTHHFLLSSTTFYQKHERILKNRLLLTRLYHAHIQCACSTL
jgi:hypothetical protein